MTDLPGPFVMVARGVARRCPVCGGGHLFRRWFTIAERCPRCGLRLEQGEGAFLGSMAINYGIAGLVFFAFLGVWLAVTLPGVDLPVLTIASLTVIAASVTLFFPTSKTIWAAFNVMLHDPSDIDLVRQEDNHG